MQYPRIIPANDSAILVEFGDSIDYVINARVYALQSTLEQSALGSSLGEMIPSYRSLLINYDLTKCDFAELSDRVAPVAEEVVESITTAATDGGQAHEIPVAYGGEHGPDLGNVAEHTGLSVDEVVDIHSGSGYRVFMLGFAPGFPYLGGMDEKIACPRLTTPRVSVPAGSVGIAESQTGVYPNESPGGWRLIGRTPVSMFDINADPPAAMLPGATVRFVPISESEYLTLSP